MTQDDAVPTRRWRLSWKVIVAAVGVVAVLGGGIAIAATGTPTSTEEFVGIQPVRVLDTRSGAGGPVGVPAAGPIGPDTTINVKVGGANGIPDDALSVAANITIDSDATLPSFLTVFPTGTARPLTSASNAEPGLVVANSAILKLGTGGQVSVYNQQGQVNVIIDITGYFVASGNKVVVVPPTAPGETTTTAASTTTTTTPVPPTVTPSITTNATEYHPGDPVTYTGTGWTGCDSLRVNLFGSGGFTVATGITPAADGSFSGTFTAPNFIDNYFLIADTSLAGFPQCRSFTAFNIVP